MMLPVSFSAILDWLHSEPVEFVVLREQPKIVLTGFAALTQAGAADVSFWVGHIESITHANGPSNESLAAVEAGLLFVPRNIPTESFPKVKCLVAVDEPYHVMVRFLEHFEGDAFRENVEGVAKTGIHPTAVVEGFVDEGCFVGPGCIVMRGARVGRGCRLESNVTIYPNVVVGEGCIFQAGVVVGSRGFGFYEHEGARRMVPHFAGVRIGNRSSFGANTVVAAGFISPTTIGDNCHLDSMVQIAHNCVLGNNIYMASQTALGGTTILEDGVQFAGGAKAAGHLTVGRNAIVTAKAGVTKSVPAGKTVAGFPAIDIDIWRHQMVELRVMAKKKLK